MSADEQPPPSKPSYSILIVSGVVALLILVGAAIYIGLDLRSAREDVAARESAEAVRPSPSAACPDGVKFTCIPGRPMPVTTEQWLALSENQHFLEGKLDRTGTEYQPVNFPGGKHTVRASHRGNTLYEVGCVVGLDPGATLDSADGYPGQALRKCAGAVVPTGDPAEPVIKAWIDDVLGRQRDARLQCATVELTARFGPDGIDIEAWAAADRSGCAMS